MFFSYAGEVIANSTITYTCLHDLYIELPNLCGALVALNRPQNLIVTPLKTAYHPWEIKNKTPRNNKWKYLWLCSSTMKEHPCLRLWADREQTLNVWNKKKHPTPPRAHLLRKAFPVQRSLSSTTHPRSQPCARHGSSGFLPPQQKPPARQQAEQCLSHLLCWQQGDTQIPPSPPSCLMAAPHTAPAQPSGQKQAGARMNTH